MDYLHLNEITYNNMTFDIKKNVKSVHTNIRNNEKKIEYYNNDIDVTKLSIFFLFETQFNLAFGHWIYENAVHLPYFKYFPNEVKILVNKNDHRNYKKLFFNLFNIIEDKIQYLDNVPLQDYDYNLIPDNNICIICNHVILTSDINQDNHKKLYLEKLFTNFYNEIFENNIFDYNKKIQHLFFPRNNSENYKPNDRIMDYSNVYKLLEGKKYIMYDTMETTDIKNQIQLLLSSENIYLDYGSSFFVNTLFCRNSNIYIIDINKYLFQFEYICNKILINFLKNKSNNNFIYL